MKFHAALTLLTLLARQSNACGCLLQRDSPEHDESVELARRAKSAAAQGKMALKNVRVFNGVIVASPSCSLQQMEVIDGGGRILLPGLTDSHVHVSDLAGLEALTSYGVTTGLNMACRNCTQCLALRAASGTGLASLLTAGVPAVGPGSQHSKVFQLSDDQLIHPTDDPAAVVSWTFGNGSNYYKITAEPNGPCQEMQVALVTEAHKLGKTTNTHASDSDAYLQAVASQTDTIQHIPADGLLSSQTLLQIKKTGQHVTPTMNIFRLAFENPAIIQFLRGTTAVNETYEAVVSNVAALRKVGVPVLAGTDAVSRFSSAAINITIPFGLTLHWELANLVEAGYMPAKGLRAATLLPAEKHELCGRGLIRPGMRADLVLLEEGADPLKNIMDTQKIARVWAGGVEFTGVAGA